MYVSCNHPRLSSAQVTERRLQEQEEQERQREEEEEERSLRQRCEELVRQEAKRMAERGYRSRVGSSAQINTSHNTEAHQEGCQPSCKQNFQFLICTLVAAQCQSRPDLFCPLMLFLAESCSSLLRAALLVC